MPRFNPKNFGVAIGRLSQDKRVFKHRGFSTVIIKLAIDDNYKDKTGKQNTQFLAFQQNVDQPNQDDGLGVYDYIGKGDLVQIIYQSRNNNYLGKDGKMVYEDIRSINNIVMLEPKAVKDERRQRQSQTPYQTEPVQPQAAPAQPAWQPIPQQNWQPVQNAQPPLLRAFPDLQPTYEMPLPAQTPPMLTPDVILPQPGPQAPNQTPQQQSYNAPNPENQFSQYMPRQ